jgi:hypothetical protein
MTDQYKDLDGLGVYNIRAAIPSPYVHVICANMEKDELAPLVYETASPNITLNPLTDLPTQYTINFNWTNFANLKTPVDEVFEWNDNNPAPSKYTIFKLFFSADVTHRIVFYKFPMDYNTVSIILVLQNISAHIQGSC